MRKNHVAFRQVSERPNDQGRYTLEPIWEGFEASFNGNDADELDRRLDEPCQCYEDTTDVSVEALDVTYWLPCGENLEAYSLQSGIMANDVRDIRRQIELPEGTEFTDCRFFVLYPNQPEDNEESEQWLVLLPQVR